MNIVTNLDAIIFLILLVTAIVLNVMIWINHKSNKRKNISKTNKLVKTGELPNFDKEICSKFDVIVVTKENKK